MEIALIIVGGLSLMTFVAAGFDFLTKRRNKIDNQTKMKVEDLERKVSLLESRLEDKVDRIGQLEKEISFVNKLIDKK